MTATASPRHPDAAWIAVVLAAICAGLHIWDLPAALPVLRQDIGVTLVQAGVLLGVVQVAGLAGGLAVSLLAELIGERRCLLAGLVMASLGSALGAVAGSVTILMISRTIDGAGSILIVVTGPGLIRRHTPRARLNTAIGYWAAFTGIATLVGLAGSAVLLQVASWRLLWWVMTALTLAPLPLVAASVPREAARGASGVAAAARRIGATARSPLPWIAALAFGCYTFQWMTVVGFLPTICQQNGLRGIWPGVLTALVGGIGAAGSIGTVPLLQRGVPVRALLIASFAAMAATAVLAFEVNWASMPAGAIMQVGCVAAFSLCGAAIPAALYRMAVDLAPPGGSTPATLGLMQQGSNAGSVAGPALIAWLVTLTGSWQSTWWMCCAFAGLGALLSWHLSQRRLGTSFGRPGRELSAAATGRPRAPWRPGTSDVRRVPRPGNL